VGRCPAVSAVVVPTPKATRIRAVWPAGACAGLKGRAQLKARIPSGCGQLSGTLVAKKLRKAFKDAKLSTGCGDGVVDPGLGETCDGAIGCGAGEHCVGCDACAPGVVAGSTTTTTVPTNVTTRCCQATGACFDADPTDAQATCATLHETLAPAGQVCNGGTGKCEFGQRVVGAKCCQCPVNMLQGFPHPQYCFDTNVPSCGPVCVQTAGVACGATTQTCGGP